MKNQPVNWIYFPDLERPASHRVKSKRAGRWYLGFAIAIGLALGGCVGSGDVLIPIPLLPVLAITEGLDSREVARVGESFKHEEKRTGMTYSVSERFGSAELREALERLNSDSFQRLLMNYNCGEPVPTFRFQLVLYAASRTGSRRALIVHSPELSPSGNSRCLLFGMGYLIDKAFAEIDPDPHPMICHLREPHCDCSSRDGTDEWVSFPGPDEVFDSQTHQWK